jgi:hypothetical protein
MSAYQEGAKMEVQVKLSTLWIVVMFNMAFADILSFMMELTTGQTPEVQATQDLMLVMAIILEIPIAMIILSRVLKYRANRWTNIIAAAITIVFVIGGWIDGPSLHILCSGRGCMRAAHCLVRVEVAQS